MNIQDIEQNLTFAINQGLKAGLFDIQQSSDIIQTLAITMAKLHEYESLKAQPPIEEK